MSSSLHYWPLVTARKDWRWKTWFSVGSRHEFLRDRHKDVRAHVIRSSTNSMIGSDWWCADRWQRDTTDEEKRSFRRLRQPNESFVWKRIRTKMGGSYHQLFREREKKKTQWWGPAITGGATARTVTAKNLFEVTADHEYTSSPYHPPCTNKAYIQDNSIFLGTDFCCSIFLLPKGPLLYLPGLISGF